MQNKIFSFLSQRIHIIFLILTAALNIAYWLHFNEPFLKPEKSDFLEYWSAFHATQLGLNPYNSEDLFSIQKTINTTRPIPLMMWNPPWLLGALFPILLLPFKISAWSWNILHVAFLFTIASLIFKLQSFSTKRFLYTVLLLLSFLPILSCATFGQIGILLGLATAGFVYNLKRENYFSAGLCSSFFILKPHLFILAALFIAPAIVRNRKYTIIFGALSGLLLMTLLTLLFAPQTIFTDWQHALHNSKQSLSPSFLEWKNSSLTSLIRELIYIRTNQFSLWPIFWVPFCGGIIGAYLLKKTGVLYQIKEIAPLAITLSVLFASFSWTFDFAILTSIYIYVSLAFIMETFSKKCFLANLWFGLLLVVTFGSLVLPFERSLNIGAYYYGWGFPCIIAFGEFMRLRFLKTEKTPYA